MDGLFDLPTHLPNSEDQDVVSNGGYVDNVSVDGVVTATAAGDERADLVEPVTAPNVNDPDATASSDKPIVIQGTNITLQTDEDIQKWIEERKKNWPTKKNMDKKLSEASKKRKIDDKPLPNKKSKQICRFFSQYKSCKFGDKCKNVHESESDLTIINGIKTQLPKPFENKYYTKDNASENSSLYKMLVKKEQFELENETFVDFLLYMEKKGLINHQFND